MKQLLVWLLPPLVGAVIGYVTNAVAIKMLFRPLRAVMIFGIRLPFTPGILPRQRHKLADNIGSMVERELFTPEIVKARLHQSEVRERIRESVRRYTEKQFAVPLGHIIPAQVSPEDDFRELLLRFVSACIRSGAFNSVMDKLFSALADTYGNRSVRDILGNAGEQRIETIIREALCFSSPGIQGAINQQAEITGPILIDCLMVFLKRDDIHREMESRGRIFLNKTILKLNVLQRLFISATQYDRTLHERMPEIVDDLILELEQALYDEAVNRRLVAFLREKGWEFFTAGESSGDFARKLSKLVLTYLDRPLEELVRQWADVELSALGQKIALRIQTCEGLDAKLGPILDHFFENHRETSLAELFSLDGDKKEKIDALLCDKLLRIVDEQIESILESIAIRTLVSDRINSLDMIRVEGIVLDVMANQLKWINVFGAILGALIGLFQAVFSHFLV